MENTWWKKAVVYQIYPRSFKDSNGDGIGDLNGIIEKLDYLQELGVDVLWICPTYASPMDDNGYDISDYYRMDPIFGTDEDMDRLLAEAGKRNIKVILDLVVNHCSDEHEWFVKAKEGENREEAGYFYFQRTKDGEEPNNWRSNFGDSVWSQLEDGRWYYHTFSKRQPDLNWENPKLREQIYKMINWWLEKGIAGFRVDAITFIKKDLTFKSRKTENGARYPVEELTDYPGIEDFLTELRDRTFAKHNCMTVAEAPGVGSESLRRYSGENGFFSMIFDDGWCDMASENEKSSLPAVENWKKKILDSQRLNNKNGWCAIFLENHDQSRCVNKFLDKKDICFESASAMAAMYFFLKGTIFIYQGQEIGMTNAVWHSIDEMNDVRAKGIYKEALGQNQSPEMILEHLNTFGRDNSRTPMQWDSGPNAGFTEGFPWLKVNENHATINVDSQKGDARSLLSFYKELIKLRHTKAYEDVFSEGEFIPMFEEVPGIIAYDRVWNMQAIRIIVKFTNQKREVMAEGGQCLLNNYADGITQEGKNLRLDPYQAMILDMGHYK